MADDNHYEQHGRQSAEIWRRWKEHGVSETTDLAVEFHFYSAHKPNADHPAKALESAGYSVHQRSRRTFLVFKGYEVTAISREQWTLGKLNDRARELELARATLRMAACGRVLCEALAAQLQP